LTMSRRLDVCRTKAGHSTSRDLRLFMFFLSMLLASGWMPESARADTLRQGRAAYDRGYYPKAAAILVPLAEAGDPRAQSIVGFLYETGRGLPQNLTVACYWYRRAAEQGDPTAQYLLGLQYDRGQGVPHDLVEAEKWLILATAAAVRPTQEVRARIRDAYLTKMTRGEIAAARFRAVSWTPRPER
jgi:TPR repeat protein